MRPSHLDPSNAQRHDRQQTWLQDRLSIQTQGQSQSNSRHNTGRSRFEDSWIDISSQPSSSSLASQNERDEIITTGLHIRRNNARRSRRLETNNNSSEQTPPRSTSVTGSSQDEYEESESESDRVMSSSNEDVARQDEDDDDQTALGIPTVERNVFTPQPNAFSHPPQSRSVPVSSSLPIDSYFPAQHQEQNAAPASSHRIPSNRVPMIQRPTQQRASSNTSPDHDAALRASLTTLLSCANAVRKERQPAQQQNTRPSTQPTALRLVAESDLNTETDHRAAPPSPKAATKRRSRESSKERHAKKVRPLSKQAVSPDEVMVSPTMMTWFISAGVVLVFSAISFSAGYAWGKEVGRQEVHLGLDTGSCGREAIRSSRTGLSKIRLGAVGA